MLGMKKQTLYRIAISVLFLLFGGLPASAQSSQYLMTIQIPFEFQVNEKQLPAGKYVIRRDQQTPQLLLIQCPEQNIWMAVHTIPHSLSEQPSRGSLIFKDYGEKRFLSEVKLLGRRDGYALIKSKAERRMAQITETKTIHATPKGATTDN
jgi:hypothetical protein